MKNRKLFLILFITCMVTGLMVMPFTFALIELPEEISLSLIVFAQMVQLAVLLAAACLGGIFFAKKIEFPGMPVLENLIEGKKQKIAPMIKEAVFWGVLGGGIVVLLCIPFWDMSVALLKEEMNVALWKSFFACFYGGTTEEVLFRLFLMSGLVWIFRKCKLKNAGVWLAIIIIGVIFGLGHLGITGGMTSITSAVILRAVLLNGSLSIIYGVLYWKRGLESAMTAHFSTDIVLHVLIPHIIAPFLFR